MEHGDGGARWCDLVLCSLESWDQVWRRNQFLVRELLELDPTLRVLFVEPPVDLLHRSSRRDRCSGPGLQAVDGRERLWRLKPTKILPRIVGPFADRGLSRQLQRSVTHLGFTYPTLWVNDSVYSSMLGEVAWPVVYDITDDWLLLQSTAPRQLARLRRQEEALMAQARAVVVCSPALAASRGTVRQVVLIPNGVDLDHFRTPRRRPPDLPPSPTAVYVGTLHDDRLDLDLCVKLADTVSGLELVLIGPSSLSRTATARLSARANVRLLGARPYDDVPAYLQHADVVVVPHLVTPFTESLDPIKAYECLAVDTPVVATPVAGFRELDGQVELGVNEEFCAAVRRALALPAPPAHRIAPPSWRGRAEQFAGVLEAAGKRPSPPHQ